MEVAQKTTSEQDLNWAELYEYSDMLVLESPDSMIDDGANLLTLLQGYVLNADLAGSKEKIPTDEFLSCLRIAEGLVRMGNQIRRRYDKEGVIAHE